MQDRATNELLTRGRERRSPVLIVGRLLHRRHLPCAARAVVPNSIVLSRLVVVRATQDRMAYGLNKNLGECIGRLELTKLLSKHLGHLYPSNAIV